MRKITAIVCLLVAIIASAQYTNPGFYRVHSANTDAYISIKGTKYVFSSKPNAFWSCILMLKDSAQVSPKNDSPTPSQQDSAPEVQDAASDSPDGQAEKDFGVNVKYL